MDLKCYVFPGWEPRVRSASSQRAWMDDAPESYPYRCLPLAIANSHGWELLSPCGFEAVWNGGGAADDVVVHADPGTPAHALPVALFGLGTVTIHIQGLFRTSPGWNLFVTGPPNTFKDGVAPLSGIIETDWSPYTFTMNWRLTRANHPVRFEADEPIAHIFPVQRAAIGNTAPRIIPIDEDPVVKSQFESWSASRDAFQQHVRDHPPQRPTDQWQKLYYRGLLPDGSCPVTGHQTKLRAPEFTDAQGIPVAAPTHPRPLPTQRERAPEPSSAQAPSAGADAAWTIAKYAWILETMERQRALSSRASEVARVKGISGSEFCDHFYAPGRPVILCDAITDWPALTRWHPDYLRAALGSVAVECQSGGVANARIERDGDTHRTTMPFDRFLDAILAKAGSDLYLTADDQGANAAVLAPLMPDIGAIAGIIDQAATGMVRVMPQGGFIPLHHDLTNSLLVQITGRSRVLLASPAQTPKLYNDRHVYSAVADLAAADLDFAAFPLLRDLRCVDLTLAPGEALFIPVGWWHQAVALDFAVSMTFTGFVWPNANGHDHPVRG